MNKSMKYLILTLFLSSCATSHITRNENLLTIAITANDYTDCLDKDSLNDQEQVYCMILFQGFNSKKECK
jgi:hypothetical protein